MAWIDDRSHQAESSHPLTIRPPYAGFGPRGMSRKEGLSVWPSGDETERVTAGEAATAET